MGRALRRLTTAYGLLRRIRFFRHFLLARSFRRWAANVKRSVYERTRAYVARRLLAACWHPALRRAVGRVAELVQAMRDQSVVSVGVVAAMTGCTAAVFRGWIWAGLMHLRFMQMCEQSVVSVGQLANRHCAGGRCRSGSLHGSRVTRRGSSLLALCPLFLSDKT